MTPYEMLMYDIKSKKTLLKAPIPVYVEKPAKDKIPTPFEICKSKKAELPQAGGDTSGETDE
jgi:hypothetical protein